MKKKILDTLFSFLGLCFMAGGIAIAFCVGVLLMPVVIVALTLYVLKEGALWWWKRKRVQQTGSLVTKQEKAKITTLPQNQSYRKAA